MSQVNAQSARGALQLAIRTGRNAYFESAANAWTSRDRYVAVRTVRGAVQMRRPDGSWFVAPDAAAIVIA